MELKEETQTEKVFTSISKEKKVNTTYCIGSTTFDITSLYPSQTTHTEAKRFTIVVLHPSTGVKLSETIYDGNHCYTTKWHANGNIKLEESQYNGMLHGEKKEFDQHGNIALRCFYENGLLNGKFIEYYPSGEKLSEVNYKNNQKDGPAFTYYENRIVMSFTEYKNGLKHGCYNEYYENGVIQVSGNYLYDTRCGVWNFYKLKKIKYTD